MKPKSTARLAIPLASAIAALLSQQSAQADNESWDGGSGGTGTAWFTPTNWVSDTGFAGSQSVTTNTDIATFTATGTGTPIGINMNFAGNKLFLGAIELTGNAARSIGNSSTTAGTLVLNGATVNAVANTILRNTSTSLMTIQATQAGTMGLELGNATDNIIQITSTGGITIGSIISGTSKSLRLQGGTTTTGALTLSGANTYSGGTTLAGGVVAISNATSFGSGNVLVTGATRINTTQGNGVNVTFANAIDVGAALQLQIPQTATGAISTFSGQLTGSSAITLVGSGGNGLNGQFAFTNTNNTFTGNVIMPSGNIVGYDHFSFNSIGDGGNFTLQKTGNQNQISYTGASAIAFGTRVLNIGTIAGNFDGNGTNPVNMFANNAANSAHTVTFNTNMTVGAISVANSLLFFGGSNTGNNTFAGTIPVHSSGAGTFGIGKTGAGKWILTGSNAYTGEVMIRNGTLSVNAIGVVANNQPLGKNTVVQLGHHSNSGILEFTGGTDSTTNKTIRIGGSVLAQAGGGTINNNGLGTLTFSAGTFNPSAGLVTVSRTLTLGGSNVGANTISGIIQNNNGTTGPVALTKANAGTWVLSGPNSYTGLTTISGGVLRITNNTALGTTAGGVTVASGSGLEIDGTGGAVSVGAEAITINGGGVTLPTPNLGAIRNIAGNNTYGGTVTLGSQSRINSDSGKLTLSSATSVSAAGFILVAGGSGDIDVTGSFTGTAGLSKDGAGTLTFTALSSTPASNNTGAIVINEGTLAFTTTSPSLSGGLTFGSSAGVTSTVGTLDLTNVGASATFGNLTVQTNSASTNTITVGNGKTLTFTGTAINVGTNAVAGTVNKLTIGGASSGVGSLVVNNAAAVVNVGVGPATDVAATASTLDLSDLGSVSLGTIASPITTLKVGARTTSGTLLLSNTANVITVTNLDLGHSNGGNQGLTNLLTLGTGTNVLNANTINIGFSKSTATLGFASQTAGSPGTVTIVNKAGANGLAALNIGSQNGTSTGTGLTGTLDLRGHIATVNVGVVTMGNTNQTGAGNANGVIRFDEGTFDATSLSLGLKSSSGTGSNNGNAVNVGGGIFTVTGAVAMSSHTGSGATGNVTSKLNVTDGTVNLESTLSVANKNGSGGGIAAGEINVSGGALNVTGLITLATQASAGTATGLLNITGGVVTANSDIVDGGGTTTTTFTLDGGSLDMTGKNIGGVTPIDVLNFRSGTLSNVNTINSTGGLTKTTAGILTLSGTNAYTGTTDVADGTLALSGGTNILADTNAVNVSNAAGIFDISAITTSETIGSLAGVANSSVELGSKNLTVSGAASTTFAGAISGTNGTLTKSGAGTLTLSGTNIYTGLTDVSGGTLLTTRAASLPGYNAASRVSVAGAATLAVRAGGAGEWTSGEIDDLLGATTAAFASGSKLGVEVTTGNTFTYGNDIGATQAAKGLVKSGDGALGLTGVQTFTGATTVTGGALAVNGVIASVSTTVSGTGSTLKGNGSIAGSVTIAAGGTLASGNSIESLAMTSLAFQALSTFEYELDKDAAANVAGDLTVVNGTLDLTGVVTLNLLESGTGAWELGNPLGDALTGSPNADKLTLIGYTGLWNGGLFTYNGNLVQDDSAIMLNGQQWWFNYNDTSAGTNYTGDLLGGSSFVTMTVPEPRAALLGGLGMLALLRRRRR